MITFLTIVACALASFNAWQFAMTGYWKLRGAQFPASDILGHGHYQRIKQIQKRYYSTWTIPVCLTGTIVTFGDAWKWAAMDLHGILQPVILIASGIVTWRAVTMDVELVAGRSYIGCRLIMCLAWIGVWYHPGFLILLLNTGVTWLRSNYHHQHLAIRTMVMFVACVGAHLLVHSVVAAYGVTLNSDVTVPTLFLLLCVCASHYFVPGTAKLKLGPRWYSWMIDNQLHAISMSAYLWGWLRFLPEAGVIRFVKSLRPFDRTFQILTISFELAAVLILFDQTLCLGLLAVFTAFHITVAVLSGIFFWQYIVVDAILIWTISTLPPSLANDLFGIQTGLAAAAVILVFPRKGKVWAPYRLAWWDTTFACRVCYEVTGVSGTRYGVYNDFMCPNERVFGQTYGECLSQELRITGHIGETSRRDCFEACHAVGQDSTALQAAKMAIGKSVYNAELEAVHDNYITTFFKNFNAGHRKRLVPLWLKAPGGQLFYWGELARFTGQERIVELVVRYREYYFDGERVTRITDTKLRHFHESDLSLYPTPIRGDEAA